MEPKSRHESQPGESRALPYDPGEILIAKTGITGPLKPLPAENQARSPISLILGGAVLIFSAIATGVIVSTSGNDVVNEFAPAVPLSGCVVTAKSDTNVRTGPGFAYDRAWILPAGESRSAEVHMAREWFRIANGWLPADAVLLDPPGACQQLPEALSPLVFSDDLDTPADVIALGWVELLGESFATEANGWTDSGEGARIYEGSLLLSHTGDNAPRAYPHLSPNPDVLDDAFFAFDLQWRAGGNEAALVLGLRETEQTAYGVRVERGGNVGIYWIDEAETQLLSETYLPGVSNDVVVGVLAFGDTLRVYLNEVPVLEVTDARLHSGRYFLTLEGSAAAVRVSRFEVKAPRNS